MTGPVEPGLAELLRTLTAGPGPGELTGERDTLAMFGANAGQSATALTTVLAGLTVTLTIGAAFGCPFEGEVPPDAVLDTAGYCLTAEPDEICLADSIGVATPAPVSAIFTALGQATTVPLRAHFHTPAMPGTRMPSRPSARACAPSM